MAREIPLSRGMYATVDDEDYERLSKYSWWVDAYGYALTTICGRTNRKNIRMHRMILGAKDGEIVDHIDGNPLNNRRDNLRIVTQSQNRMNARPRSNLSGFKGVGWYKHYGKWQARIYYNGRAVHLGYYDDPVEAARAYNTKARELFGEYARLNEIPDERDASA